jgi:hypothetical protein
MQHLQRTCRGLVGYFKLVKQQKRHWRREEKKANISHGREGRTEAETAKTAAFSLLRLILFGFRNVNRKHEGAHNAYHIIFLPSEPP